MKRTVSAKVIPIKNSNAKYEFINSLKLFGRLRKCRKSSLPLIFCITSATSRC